MYNTTPLRNNIKLWNNTAKDCYELGCECKKCFIYKTFFIDGSDICHMKYYVEKLLEKIGEPD